MKYRFPLLQFIRRCQPALVMMCAVSGLAGCAASEPEKETGTVSLTITFDGKPVNEGSVSMIVIGSSQSASGELNDAGTVTLEDVETGTYVVSVLPPPPPDAVAGEPPAVPQSYANIPQKFRSETTSTLKAEVKSGDNEFSFDLKDAK